MCPGGWLEGCKDCQVPGIILHALSQIAQFTEVRGEGGVRMPRCNKQTDYAECDPSFPQTFKTYIIAVLTSS